MSKGIQEALLYLRARQEAGEHMPCPRCGRDTMKHAIHTNALSRHADGIYVCDDCGTAEAMLDFMQNPLPLDCWAVFREERPSGDFKEVSGAEAWEEIRITQLPFLTHLFEHWQDVCDVERFDTYRQDTLKQCKGLIDIWEQPFHVRYAVKDGELTVRFRATEHGVEVAWDITGKKL